MCCLQGGDAPNVDAPVDAHEAHTAVFVTDRRGKSRNAKRKLSDSTPVTAEVHMIVPHMFLWFGRLGGIIFF